MFDFGVSIALANRHWVALGASQHLAENLEWERSLDPQPVYLLLYGWKF
jgi:hypothetical protein